MQGFKKNIKKYLKQTDYYQGKKETEFYQKRRMLLSRLEEDEKAARYAHVYFKGNKTEEYVNLLNQIIITLRPKARYQSWIDTGLYFSRLYAMTDNVPPNYDIILNNSIDGLKQLCEGKNSDLSNNIITFLDAVLIYLDRIIEKVDQFLSFSHTDSCGERMLKTKEYFLNMKTEKCQCLEEAFQRILFWSDLFWQSQHRLVGIGRLDKLLVNYTLPDNYGEIIHDFYLEMHRYFAYKSNGMLLGDTGQIIELGGLEPDGSYYCNEYTFKFIEILKEQPIPEPKLLLRVSKNMPDTLLELALECIATGVGCPLLSNDEVVIPALKSFGYKHDDACNYVTSACWEPLAYGKSLEKNNMSCINYGKCFEKTYSDSCFESRKTFQDICELFLTKVDSECARVIGVVDATVWEEDPLSSLFTDPCLQSGKDISEGGAQYNNYGVLSVGMANAVDSLLNIKKKCFDDCSCTLSQIKEICLGKQKQKNADDFHKWFGRDDEAVTALVNAIAERTYRNCSQYRNKFGGKLKWGLSASNYVESGESIGATFDGRANGDPLAVHISAPGGVAYTELINFASNLNYDGQRANGNVVDFFVSPDLIRNNRDKFLTFIKASIVKGFFQMQMNVVSSRTLIEARKDPEAFPDLIVRVWGFSAYFKDLPENYKDILIKRALESEMSA